MDLLRKSAKLSLATSAVVLAVAAVKALLFFRRMNKIFDKLEVPGPKSHVILGSIPEILKLGKGPKADGDQLFQSFRKLREQYGDIVKLRFGPLTYVLIFDTQTIKEIGKYPKSAHYEKLSLLTGKGLVMLNGEEWQRHRKLMSYGFTYNELKKYFPHFLGDADILVDNMKEGVRRKGEVVFSELVTDCTLDIISGCGFGFNFNAQKKENLEYRHLFEDVLKLAENRIVQLGGVTGTKLMRWWNKGWLSKIDDLLYGVIDKRIKETEQEKKDRLPDLLDLLMAAKLTKQEMRDELFIFYLAGHETTALTLTKKLQEEISQVCARKDTIRFEEVAKLEFMQKTIQEVLRLHPPASIITREVPEDTTLNGYKVPKNTNVMIPIQHLHHDPNFWHAPEVFDPELHFGADVKDDAYIPFSFGPRQCIGRWFFWIEARVILTRVLQSFENIKMVGEQTLPGVTLESGTSHPDRNITLTMEIK